MRALLIYPTHENCDEVEQDLLAAGLSAMTYPPRSTTGNEHRGPNCRNPEADDAEKIGFPVVKTVCPVCPHRRNCLDTGYLGQLIRVQNATVALCTHARAEYGGLAGLTDGRPYVAIHEDPIDVLRPRCELWEFDLRAGQMVLNWMLDNPRYWEWFGEACRCDEEGNLYQDEEQAVRRDRQYRFCLHLADMVDRLIASITAANETVEWRPTETMRNPAGVERTLFRAVGDMKATFRGDAWRFLLAAAAGDLKSAAILVTKSRAGGDAANRIKKLVGYRHNPPSPRVTTWFNDATTNADRLVRLLGMPVEDQTPGGRIALQKKAVQIARDVTRGTSAETFRKIVRGVLTDRPQFLRIGLICHRPHLAAAKSVEPEFACRIVKTTYFGSGEERSSNAWHRECDLILIAGTPRVPPQVVQEYLLQVGEVGAACRDGRWGAMHWKARTESGELVRIAAKNYRDDDWRSAHRDLVRAALVQAIGRGRGILADGCEVIVLSTEECGLPLSDAGMDPMNSSSHRILTALHQLTMENPKKHLLSVAQ